MRRIILNEKTWPTLYDVRVLEKGIVSYEDAGAGIALLDQEAVTKIMNGCIGKPVISRIHKDITPENYKEHAVGYITKWWYDKEDGWAWCSFLVTDDKTKEDIEKNFSVSCAYDVLKSTGTGGDWHSIHYDEQILDGAFQHLCIVDTPRYESAGVPVENRMTMVVNGKGARMVKENATKKIDIYVDGKYATTTEQSATCKEAVERYIARFGQPKGKVTASFTEYHFNRENKKQFQPRQLSRGECETCGKEVTEVDRETGQCKYCFDRFEHVGENRKQNSAYQVWQDPANHKWFIELDGLMDTEAGWFDSKESAERWINDIYNSKQNSSYSQDDLKKSWSLRPYLEKRARWLAKADDSSSRREADAIEEFLQGTRDIVNVHNSKHNAVVLVSQLVKGDYIYFAGNPKKIEAVHPHNNGTDYLIVFQDLSHTIMGGSTPVENLNSKKNSTKAYCPACKKETALMEEDGKTMCQECGEAVERKANSREAILEKLKASLAAEQDPDMQKFFQEEIAEIEMGEASHDDVGNKQNAQTQFECMECGKKFAKTLGEKTVEVKCPGCGGYDTEVANSKENELIVKRGKQNASNLVTTIGDLEIYAEDGAFVVLRGTNALDKFDTLVEAQDYAQDHRRNAKQICPSCESANITDVDGPEKFECKDCGHKFNSEGCMENSFTVIRKNTMDKNKASSLLEKYLMTDPSGDGYVEKPDALTPQAITIWLKNQDGSMSQAEINFTIGVWRDELSGFNSKNNSQYVVIRKKS